MKTNYFLDKKEKRRIKVYFKITDFPAFITTKEILHD